MHRLFSSVIVLCMVGIILTGCGSPGTSGTNPQPSQATSESARSQTQSDVTLSVINTKTDSKDYFTKFFNDFTAKTGIKIQYDVVASDQYGTVLPTRISSGDMPDVFQVFPGATEVGVVRFAKNGSLMDVTNDPFVTNQTDATLAQLVIDDKQYCIATAQAVLAVLYNKALFQKAGIDKAPADINEFYVDCDKLKAAGITPMAVAGKAGLTFESFQIIPTTVFGPDPDFMTKAQNGTASFDSEGWQKGCNMILEMQSKGYFEDKPLGVDYNAAEDMFLQGKVAMIFNGNWSFSDITTKGGDSFQFGAFFFPANDPGTDYVTAGSLSELYSISSETKHPVEAKMLLQYFNDNASSLLSEYQALPVTKGAQLSNPSPAVTELLPALQSHQQHTFLNNEWPAGMIDQFNKGLQEILGQTKTTAQMLKELNDYYIANKDK